MAESTENNSGILFIPAMVRAEITNQKSLLELALENGVEIAHSCDGNGTCTTCRVVVEKGLERLPERNEIESEVVDGRGFKPEERLSCQMIPVAGLEILVP